MIEVVYLEHGREEHHKDYVSHAAWSRLYWVMIGARSMTEVQGLRNTKEISIIVDEEQQRYSRTCAPVARYIKF
jgi:hypothetical protein